jgi:flagellar FliJ protein
MDDKIRRLQPAVEAAGVREDDAAKALADFQQHLVQQQTQLQQLLTFRSEYQDKLHSAGQSGISGRSLHNYQSFLANIDASIAQSQQQLQGLEKVLQQKRTTWITQRAKSHALKEVISGYRIAQDQISERRQQSESDEQALRSSFNKSAGYSGT